MAGIRKVPLLNRKEVVEPFKPDELEHEFGPVTASKAFEFWLAKMNKEALADSERLFKYFTIDEVCDWLDISRVTFQQKFINRGLPHMRIMFKHYSGKIIEPRPSIVIKSIDFLGWMISNLDVKLEIRSANYIKIHTPLSFPPDKRDLAYRKCSDRNDSQFLVVRRNVFTGNDIRRFMFWLHPAFLDNSIVSLETMAAMEGIAKSSARVLSHLVCQLTIDRYRRYILTDPETLQRVTLSRAPYRMQMFLEEDPVASQIFDAAASTDLFIPRR